MAKFRPIRSEVFVAGPNDPAELEAATARHREYKQTALGQMGCCLVVDAPLPLLAQFSVELPPDDRKLFLGELIARLPPEVLTLLAESLRARAGTDGAGVAPIPSGS
jgi:hypothetical protein